MSSPAHTTEAPSIAKVWRQLNDNAATFAVIWALIFVTCLTDIVFSTWLALLIEKSGRYSAMETVLIEIAGSLPTTILASLAAVLMVAVCAIYYTTDHFPRPRQVLGILRRRPLRYLLAGMLFAGASIVGLLLCVIPGVLVGLTQPIYVHYVFTTDLDPLTCLSKAFKAMFQEFGRFLAVSLLCGLAVIASALVFFVPVLAILPMATLYMQNYIHHRGLVSVRKLA